MMSEAAAILISELVGAVRHHPPERSARILERVTELLLLDSDRLSEAQLAVFDDVIIRLVRVSDVSALGALGAKISGLPRAPKATIQHLASHDHVLVAGPVLSASICLAEQHLIEIGKTRSLDHLLALCQRKTLDHKLTDTLIGRGYPTVSLALVKNEGAEISRRGFAVLMGSADNDDELAASLVSRSDTPPEVSERLLQKTRRNVRTRLLHMAPTDIGEKIESVVATGGTAGPNKSRSFDFSAVETIILELSRTGRLGDRTVNRFAVDREYDKIGMALAVLATVNVKAIEPLLTSTRPDGLIIACRASRLDWSTVAMVLRNRFEGALPSQQMMAAGRAAFDTLSLSAAQRAIRFWEFRCTGGGSRQHEPQPENVQISNDQELILV